MLDVADYERIRRMVQIEGKTQRQAADGNTHAKWSQNTQAKWSRFGLKNNVRNGRLSTDLAVAPSAHFFS